MVRCGNKHSTFGCETNYINSTNCQLNSAFAMIGWCDGKIINNIASVIFGTWQLLFLHFHLYIHYYHSQNYKHIRVVLWLMIDLNSHFIVFIFENQIAIRWKTWINSFPAATVVCHPNKIILSNVLTTGFLSQTSFKTV